MTQHNRIAMVGTLLALGVSILIFKYRSGADRILKLQGLENIDAEWLEQDLKKRQLWMSTVMRQPKAFESNLAGDQYRNPRKDDNKIRWDIREIDRNVLVADDEMRNPFDDRK